MYAYNYLPMPNGVGNNKKTGYNVNDYPKSFKK
jgi:hypothetical protein